MNRSTSVWACLAALMFLFGWSPVFGDEDAATPPPAAKPPAEKRPAPAIRTPYRPLAPGVMISIDPMRALKESVSRHNVIELLAVDPKLDWAKDVPFRRDVWALDFQFKPVRMIWIDIPQPSGYMQRKLIWYMVYSVTNTGRVMHSVENEDLPYEVSDKRQLAKVEWVDRPVRFTPEFLLEAQVRRPDKSILKKVYPDRVIPVAMGPIRLREEPSRRFLTSVEMCRELKVGETQWGVATWEDIDPKTFEFSIYVTGLTNSYRWTDQPGEYKNRDPIGKGRKLFRKTLKLNFWRPGDQYHEHEDEIRYGVPQELLPKERDGSPKVPEGVDYEWVYR
jgi:hypothetical protein